MGVIILLLILNHYIYFYRNRMVSRFMIKISHYETIRIIQKLYTGSTYKEVTKNRLYNKYKYNNYLYSTKPLKFEKWFTEEEIKDLFNINDN